MRILITGSSGQIGANLAMIIRYVANLDKARALLDYSPKIPLQDGIRRAVAWGEEWLHRGAPPERSVIVGARKHQFAT